MEAGKVLEYRDGSYEELGIGLEEIERQWVEMSYRGG